MIPRKRASAIKWGTRIAWAKVSRASTSACTNASDWISIRSRRRLTRSAQKQYGQLLSSRGHTEQKRRAADAVHQPAHGHHLYPVSEQRQALARVEDAEALRAESAQRGMHEGGSLGRTQGLSLSS